MNYNVDCPKCANKFDLTDEQQAEIEFEEETSAICPHCKVKLIIQEVKYAVAMEDDND